MEWMLQGGQANGRPGAVMCGKPQSMAQEKGTKIERHITRPSKMWGKQQLVFYTYSLNTKYCLL
jgi:hypothetical protein